MRYPLGKCCFLQSLKNNTFNTTSEEEIFEIIVVHIVEVLPGVDPHNVSMHDSLNDLGANSVDRAEIVMMTLESLSLNIPRVEVFGTHNIEELVELLHTKLVAT
jgi:polyketide biosynthesis acyl carrier protein